MDQKLMGIGAMARFAGCGEDTARRLESAGVITAMRDSAGRRLFTTEQAQALKAHVEKRRKA